MEDLIEECLIATCLFLALVSGVLLLNRSALNMDELLTLLVMACVFFVLIVSTVLGLGIGRVILVYFKHNY